MRQVESISIDELREMAEQSYGEFVKAVVDVDQRLVVVDAEMHADEEEYLLQHGSHQEALWGINLYPDYFDEDDFVEFSSLINIRPSQGNRTLSVDDPQIQNLIIEIVAEVVHA